METGIIVSVSFLGMLLPSKKIKYDRVLSAEGVVFFVCDGFELGYWQYFSAEGHVF